LWQDTSIGKTCELPEACRTFINKKDASKDFGERTTAEDGDTLKESEENLPGVTLPDFPVCTCFEDSSIRLTPSLFSIVIP
jgi:hypothetical protein